MRHPSPPTPRGRTGPARPRRLVRRDGATLVWFATMLVVLLGLLGLVVDAGLMLADYRQIQNAADAGAMAAALEMYRGNSTADATAAAVTFVRQRNGLPGTPDPTVNIPPAAGPYAGESGYVEVIASGPRRTYLMHLLSGGSADRTVRARAVAGVERVGGDGLVYTLNPEAVPGLRVQGQGNVTVEGAVVINSQGGGVDENGQPIDNGNNGFGATVSNNATFSAMEVDVAGGVNNPDNFQGYPLGEPSNLTTDGWPQEDPLAALPVPTTANGVINVFRGEPSASDGKLKLGDQQADFPKENVIVTDPVTGDQTMILQPGIYTSIKVSGGNVVFTPGIYVLRPEHNTNTALSVTGGNVVGQGIMFYNTGDNYNAETGWPDSLDGQEPPPAEDGARFGGVTINAELHLSGISSTYPYDPPVASEFDGMLLYQRRRNTEAIRLEGDADQGDLDGTMYAKWANLTIAGQGTFDGPFVVGDADIAGQGDVTIAANNNNLPPLPRVFLVE